MSEMVQHGERDACFISGWRSRMDDVDDAAAAQAMPGRSYCSECGTYHQLSSAGCLGQNSITNRNYRPQYGWVCPVCGRGNNPDKLSCDCRVEKNGE